MRENENVAFVRAQLVLCAGIFQFRDLDSVFILVLFRQSNLGLVFIGFPIATDQVERSVRCIRVCVFVCVCLSMQTIIFDRYDIQVRE